MFTKIASEIIIYFNQDFLIGTERTHKNLDSLKKSHQTIEFLKIYGQNNKFSCFLWPSPYKNN